MKCNYCKKKLMESEEIITIFHKGVAIATVDYTICKKCKIVDIPRQEYDFQL